MQLFFCGFLCAACGVVGALLASFCALVGGLLGLVGRSVGWGVAHRWSRQSYAGLALGGGIVFLALGSVAWGFLRSLPAFNTTVMDDEALEPFVAAINEVDRASLGFTPIPPDATVRIERARRDLRGYDVMLHVYAETSRTVAFTEEDGSYRWVGEQEIHRGPDQYETADGVLNEQITITYDTVRGFRAPSPLNTIHIFYYGDDPRLRYKTGLTLEDVLPILEEWKPLHTPTATSLQ